MLSGHWWWCCQYYFWHLWRWNSTWRWGSRSASRERKEGQKEEEGQEGQKGQKRQKRQGHLRMRVWVRVVGWYMLLRRVHSDRVTSAMLLQNNILPVCPFFWARHPARHCIPSRLAFFLRCQAALLEEKKDKKDKKRKHRENEDTASGWTGICRNASMQRDCQKRRCLSSRTQRSSLLACMMENCLSTLIWMYRIHRRRLLGHSVWDRANISLNFPSRVFEECGACGRFVAFLTSWRKREMKFWLLWPWKLCLCRCSLWVVARQKALHANWLFNTWDSKPIGANLINLTKAHELYVHNVHSLNTAHCC